MDMGHNVVPEDFLVFLASLKIHMISVRFQLIHLLLGHGKA